jgi:F-type H+-transporting ATPase subunit epsilon
MKTFMLAMRDGHRVVDIDDTISLVAIDASGAFGVQAGHADLLTVIEPGLFRYRTRRAPDWNFGASLGGMLHCRTLHGRTAVCIVSGRFLLGPDPAALQSAFEKLLESENQLRVSTRESRLQLEFVLYKRMQELAKAVP